MLSMSLLTALVSQLLNGLVRKGHMLSSAVVNRNMLTTPFNSLDSKDLALKEWSAMSAKLKIVSVCF